MNNPKLIAQATAKRKASKEEESKQEGSRFRWESSVPEGWHKFLRINPPKTASPTNRQRIKQRASTANPLKTRPHTTNFAEYEDRLLKLNNDFSDENFKYNQLYQYSEDQKTEVIKPEFNKEIQSPCYSIKYLGITNGQIGILSKRAPIPQLSPLESCKDVPLPLIYSTSKDTRISNSIINQIITRPTSKSNERFEYKPPENFTSPSPILSNIKKSEQTIVIDETLYPNPEAYNKYIIHTYARPRGLITQQKDFPNEHDQNFIDLEAFNSKFIQMKRRFDLSKQKPVETPVYRTGVTGWKLSRPKSTSPGKRYLKTFENSKEFQQKPDSSTEKTQEVSTQPDDISQFYNEPYLKYLSENKGLHIKRAKTKV
ncbi:unnamed protein product [Blepharisma stoltei]|uniref:Uncharacterized protein n=1 Tax=Blepharisma stoltei TaxID=1481888 RepID=A0AAU9J6J2_9CILI|nr:unnamed protein product [Blepharisma stoltei]